MDTPKILRQFHTLTSESIELELTIVFDKVEKVVYWIFCTASDDCSHNAVGSMTVRRV